MFSPVMLLVAIRIGFSSAQGAAAPAEPVDTELRIMSFNIRYGTAADGDNHWDKRRDFLLQTIRDFRPDLLGTQETLKFQRDFLADQLPGWQVLGVGRDDGADEGEMTAVCFRTDRFDLLDSGHFWLSETPDVPGSRSWDSALPRMATWIRLKDRLRPMARPILFLNTHFDHMGVQARRESAELMKSRMRKFATDCSVIVTGDFNTAEGSEPWVTLFGSVNDAAPTMIDSFRKAHPEQQEEEGTFNGFLESRRNGPRIDWIGVSPDFRVVSAEIVRTSRDGRTPSDHFPVTAVLQPDSD